MAELSSPPSQLHIGRYAVESKLGEGGMAETWLCRLEGARGFSKHVVIKTLKPDCRDGEFLTMFSDEARLGAQLEHPNIPRVIELGQVEAGPFMVQEYVDGPNLIQILKQQSRAGVFNLRMACRIVSDVANALEHAYTALDDQGRPLKVIHRDVSPSNILVSRRGVTKLIDFGVALFVDRETRTQAGVLKGKLRYMAPEVMLHGDVSHQGDLYSLGIVLYTLCVGEPPWGIGGSTNSTFATGTDGDTPRGFATPSSRRPGIDPVLDGIIQRCLHMERARRFSSGKELAAALNGWLAAYGGPVQDAEVAARLAELYPQGPSDWRAEEATVATIRSEPEPEPVSIAMAGPWRWLVIATVALFSLSVVLLLLVVVGLSLLLPSLQPGAPPSVAPDGLAAQAEEVEAQARQLLDAAALALADNDLAEAGRRIDVANALVISDPDLTGLRAELDAELRFRSKLLAVRELSKVDPIAGLEQVRALSTQYPDHPDLAALLASLDATGTTANKPEPGADEPSPQPRKTPPSPRPHSNNDLLGTRTERAPAAEPAPTAEPAPSPVPAPEPKPPEPNEVLQQRQR